MRKKTATAIATIATAAALAATPALATPSLWEGIPGWVEGGTANGVTVGGNGESYEGGAIGAEEDGSLRLSPAEGDEELAGTTSGLTETYDAEIPEGWADATEEAKAVAKNGWTTIAGWKDADGALRLTASVAENGAANPDELERQFLESLPEEGDPLVTPVSVNGVAGLAYEDDDVTVLYLFPDGVETAFKFDVGGDEEKYDVAWAVLRSIREAGTPRPEVETYGYDETEGIPEGEMETTAPAGRASDAGSPRVVRENAPAETTQPETVPADITQADGARTSEGATEPGKSRVKPSN